MKEIQRYIKKAIQSLAFSRGKMVFISGPRQVGKTTLAKEFAADKHYYNWDESVFRRLWAKDPTLVLKGNPRAIVLDEIHKAKNWKRSLKGLFDTLKYRCNILVTGSAKLNVYKRGGDSLLGRYLLFRLHPLSLGELLKIEINEGPKETIEKIFSQKKPPLSSKAESIFADLLKYGGFPEPYANKSENYARIWRRGRHEKIIREDLRDLSRLPELSQLEILAALLPDKVMSPLSLETLREDLEVSHNTVKRWLAYFEYLYLIYFVRPYSKNLARTLKREPKLYFWDWTDNTNASASFENLVGSHLLKACHYWEDLGFEKTELFYIRNKEKLEVDFLLVVDEKPFLSIEVKLNETNLDPTFLSFEKHLRFPFHVQIVRKSGVWEQKKCDHTSVLVASADKFFTYLP